MPLNFTQDFDDLDACVEATLTRIGKRIVLGLPVGIGKPNTLVNAFVRRACADSSIQLTIFTALSLRAPRARSDLERRFLQPFVDRVFGDYPELEYVRALEGGTLPKNIEVNEFFLEPGAWLRNEHLQSNYLSSNYTHVARDLIRRGVNVIAQLVVPSTDGVNVSLSCNPDLTVDLLPHIEAQRATGQPFVLIGQVHRQLPYMYGDAEQPRTAFDFIVDPPGASFPLFCPPNMPISMTDYAIALNVSALVRDGGTLQLGIGELGDAIVYGLKLRHEQSGDFVKLLNAGGLLPEQSSLIESEGGVEPFARGIYGCTEMLVDGFIDLYRAGILKRRVYPHALLQTALDTLRIDERVSIDTLNALSEAGLERITARDFSELQTAGVFRSDARFAAGKIQTADGHSFAADLSTSAARVKLAKSCLGEALQNGVLAHGGFFFGPKAFYTALRELPEEDRRQFAMQRISFVNELYGEQQALKVAQRRHARFVNTTMMVTGLGAAVSDGLADGRVVSGVGGQYNFVAMAHALPDARSILCVRSTRTTQGRTASNIVWNYGHTTIPRHLRDIVVTEYGIADLRGRTDGETVAALVNVMDARFQDELVSQAKRSGKLPRDYRVPERARANIPQRLSDILQPFRSRGLFNELPFGSDFTAEEIVIAGALKRLQAETATRWGRYAALIGAAFSEAPDASLDRYLRRLGLDQPDSFKLRLTQRLVASALRNGGSRS
jgi:acyl-CoA hydrolase